MISGSPANNTITFQSQELAEKICQAVEDKPTGYWKIHLNVPTRTNSQQFWYLALSRKRVIFSGLKQIHWSGFLEILERYIPHLRSSKIQQQIAAIKKGLADGQKSSPIILLNQMVAKEIVDYSQVTLAMQLQVLNDFDTYLFDYSGQAQFLTNTDLFSWPVFCELALEPLIAEAKQRQQQWKQLKPFIPSPEGIPQLNLEALKRQNLTVKQKQQLQKLTNGGKTLREIAYHTGKDLLEMAQTFARLGQKGLITFGAMGNNTLASPAPKIFIIDDSPVMLRNFQTIVTNLGYQVSCCNDALQAIPAMLACQPAAIFVDVNMPELSGFQLIKKIRLQPKLTSVPLVILTAEKSLSNQMRAKWSKSQFITKPLNKEEMSHFYAQLRSILHEIAP